MKKITLLAAVVFTAFISHAQITKGSTFIGGHLSGNSNQDEADNSDSEIKSSNWGVGLEFGKFIANNKAVGIFANFQGSRYKQHLSSSYDNNKESKGIGAGVFYRQYFPLAAKWYLFGEADLGYGKNTSEEKVNNIQTIKTKGWGISTSITPGVAFAAGRRIFIETSFNNLLGIGYSQSNSDCYDAIGNYTGSTKKKSFNGTANTGGFFNNIQIGLRWILPAKK